MDRATDGENDVYTQNKGFLIRLIVISLTTAAALTGMRSAAAQSADAYLGGTTAPGRVAEVYLRGGSNVFLALKHAPQHLRQDAERWVDVEFADSRANEIAPAPTVVNRSQTGVQVGDAVQIQFAHRENPRYFPLKEAARVTALVNTRNETLAQGNVERDAPGVLPAFWQQQPRAHTTNSSIAPGAATAGIAR